jgi:hypothetical protein
MKNNNNCIYIECDHCNKKIKAIWLDEQSGCGLSFVCEHCQQYQDVHGNFDITMKEILNNLKEGCAKFDEYCS